MEIKNDFTDNEWHGNWFPKRPGEADPSLDVHNEIDSSTSYTGRMKTMGIQDPQCDDAEVVTVRHTHTQTHTLSDQFHC